MNALPLQLRDGHLFIELNGELWLLDTGAPNSFGTNNGLSLAGEQFRLGSSYLGLTAATLSGFVGFSVLACSAQMSWGGSTYSSTRRTAPSLFRRQNCPIPDNLCV